MNDSIRIGTLGSAATFAGEATIRMRERYPEFGEPVYFPSMDDCWRELAKGTVDVMIIGVERTGQPHHGNGIITHGFYVMAEHAQPLGCNLYVKPGARKSDIRQITGHGSLFQCTAYLDREFPGVEREAHGLNSVAAAKAMMAGDGTLAVVGSRSLPSMVSGLETFAIDIDDGAIASWWAVSKKPFFSNAPDVLVVTVRCGDDGELGRLLDALSQRGFNLTTAAAFPVNTGVFVYDYILKLRGQGRLIEAEQVIAEFWTARLAGAFKTRPERV